MRSQREKVLKLTPASAAKRLLVVAFIVSLFYVYDVKLVIFNELSKYFIGYFCLFWALLDGFLKLSRRGRLVEAEVGSGGTAGGIFAM